MRATCYYPFVDPVTARRHLERLADRLGGERDTLNAVATLLVGLTLRVAALREAIADHRATALGTGNFSIGGPRDESDVMLWDALSVDDERALWYEGVDDGT